MHAMAARKSYRYLSGAGGLKPPSADHQLELDEAEIWSTNDGIVLLPEIKEQSHDHHRRRKASGKIFNVDNLPDCPKSPPVSIPDWSKILGSEHSRRIWDCEDEEEEGDGNKRIAPHEYLARRTGTTSLSVEEGMGRKLKRRDLSRVRDAIWKQTGFED